MLAASKVSAARGQKSPLMLVNANGLSSYASSPVAVSTMDLQSLKAIPSERSGETTSRNGTGAVYLVNSGPQPPNMDPEKFLPSNWQVVGKISLDTLPVVSTSEKSGTATEKQQDTAACFVRMQIASTVTEGVAELAHRVCRFSTSSPILYILQVLLNSVSSTSILYRAA